MLLFPRTGARHITSSSVHRSGTFHDCDLEILQVLAKPSHFFTQCFETSTAFQIEVCSDPGLIKRHGRTPRQVLCGMMRVTIRQILPDALIDGVSSADIDVKSAVPIASAPPSPLPRRTFAFTPLHPALHFICSLSGLFSYQEFSPLENPRPPVCPIIFTQPT